MERRTFTFEQQSAQVDFILQENEFLMWYDTITNIKVDQKLSDLFLGTHSQTFHKVKKSFWPSPLLKACFFCQVDLVPPQPVAAKVTVLYVAVHLNLRLVVTSLDGINGRLIQTSLRGENDWKQSDEFQAVSDDLNLEIIFLLSIALKVTKLIMSQF